MKDIYGRKLEVGNKVKYSFNAIGIPLFTGEIIEKDHVLYVLHSNKLTVIIDDSIQYIEIMQI